MSGGQQIDAGTGTLQGLGADNNFALSGTASAGALTEPGQTRFHPLQSKKFGTGTAEGLLTGQAATVAAGLVLYQGLAVLSWNANPEPDVIAYRIYHGTTPGVYFGPVPQVAGTTYQFGGLTPHTTHYFAVTAVDAAGNESGKSVEASKAY